MSNVLQNTNELSYSVAKSIAKSFKLFVTLMLIRKMLALNFMH